jgi:poly(A) polymerase
VSTLAPARRIAPRQWMEAPETRAVLAALESDGAAARFAGGAVRDAVLGRDAADIDIATTGRPEENVRLLKRAGLRVIPTGLAHGTVTAISGGRAFEVTTLRIDMETFGRHARVAFTEDWAADAARRDFTMNALYANSSGEVWDPTGGLADLAAGRVRFVGEPAARIAEDYLRILRFFRFHAWYGRGKADRTALAACAAGASGLDSLSGERLRQELLKLLAAPDPVPALRLMAETGVAAKLLPPGPDIEPVARLVSNDPVLRLAALVSAADAVAVLAMAERLKLSNADRDRLLFRAAPPALPADDDGAAARRAIYDFGQARIADLARLCGRPELAAFAERWTPPAPPVAGADALALGLAPGPRVGELLRAVEAWWRERDFAPDRDACLVRLRELLGETPKPS